MKPQIRALNPAPVQQAAAFTPPQTTPTTVDQLAHNTLAYWATIRIAWLSGYKLSWVIPGREGAVSSGQSVWSLDPRVQMQPEIKPARTSRYEVDPYVVVAGRPHQEPLLGTSIKVTTSVRSTASTYLVKGRSTAPSGLGETARWLPYPASYSAGVWSPQTPAPAPDASIRWVASEANVPVIYNEFEYARRGEWVTAPTMALSDINHLRLEGMPLSTGVSPHPPITMFFVLALNAPSKYWTSMLRALEPDGATSVEQTNLDFRLMPDGMVHPYTLGWLRALPLVGENHTLSMFGFTLDSEHNSGLMFTIDRSLQFSPLTLFAPHSITSKFVLGLAGEAVTEADLLDVLFYRGALTIDQISDIANELDAAYGITAHPSQEQG